MSGFRVSSKDWAAVGHSEDNHEGSVVSPGPRSATSPASRPRSIPGQCSYVVRNQGHLQFSEHTTGILSWGCFVCFLSAPKPDPACRASSLGAGSDVGAHGGSRPHCLDCLP